MKFSIYIIFTLSLASVFLVACSSEASSCSDEPASNPAEEKSGDTTQDPQSHDDGGHEHGADHSSHDPDSNAQVDSQASSTVVIDYPLFNCPVSGAELGSMGNLIIEVIEGREVRFCCAGCPDKFKADKENYFSTMDASIIAMQAKDYPLDFCLVSGDELGGDHGKSIDVIVSNQLFRVCCKSCIKELKTDSAEFLSLLRDARSGKDVPRPEGSSSKNEENHKH